MDDPVSVPIGFWLRTVDALLEPSMDETFAAEGVTRRLWQVLSSIKHNEPASTKDIDEAMALFLDEEAPTTSSLLEDLEGRSWIEGPDGRWRLTQEGRSAVDRLGNQLMRHREVMFRGVDDADYRTTVETLARISSNLDPQGVRTAKFR